MSFVRDQSFNQIFNVSLSLSLDQNVESEIKCPFSIEHCFKGLIVLNFVLCFAKVLVSALGC
jgi:hypothetical protein